jgi:2-polyprenyl-6-methoxyphenol hydroxylase-like FAD-dependent oxidoreductase
MPDFDDGLAETEIPTGAAVETDVLIVGSGPAGGAAALCLATLGVPNIMITKYRWTANTPRAHITNQRAMEIFRDLGIEDQVLADATPHELIGDTVFCTSLAGEEIGRIRTWGTHPAREADYQLASPCLICDIPQTYLEPILVKNATSRGTQTRFSTEYLSHAQDDDGVTTTVRDRLTGATYTIRSQYLIGADGARSLVAEHLALPYEGQMDIAGSMNITFKATRPEPQRDPELYYQASTVPGSHLPHAWVGDTTNKVSTLDLAPYDAFTLLTGIAGQQWEQAAAKVSDDLNVPIKTVVIGPGREVTDIYYDWARIREIEEDGVLLIRPDKFIGWRSMSMPASPERALRDALKNLLSIDSGR